MVQFHLEVTEEMIQDWMKSYGEELKDQDLLSSQS